MTEQKQTAGAALVAKLTGWIGSYMAMDRAHALVACLWALNTWTFKNFDAVPYLCITAATKQSGKTVLLEILSMLSLNAKVLTDPTASTLFRMMDAADGAITLMFDEAETLSSEQAKTMRSFMNSGYRKGQTLPRTLPGGRVHDFPVFGPKAFCLIGDVNDTLRDRAIVFRLSRGIPSRKYRHSEARQEASALTPQIQAVLGSLPALPYVEADWLRGRDEEIWSPLVSLATALGLPKEDMDLLLRASADLTAAKTAKAHRYVDLRASEDDAVDVSYAEVALRDLLAVLKDADHIYSGVAIDKMKELPTAPWRTFRGTGLDAISLANLVSRFGVKPVLIKRRGIVQRGYRGADIRRAVAASGQVSGVVQG